MTAPHVAVLDYGIGNLRSAQKALEAVGADARLTTDAAVARAADAVVLPGVGAFGACMRALRSSGLEEVVHESVDSGRPFLGICVGMQMLFSGSDEDPDDPGLGVLPGRVEWIPDSLPRPQMQWNRLRVVRNGVERVDPLFEGLETDPWVYFVHSLHGVPTDASAVVATCEYGGTINAVFRSPEHPAVVATQFHPEKSGATGLHMLRNWLGTVTA
ncbi:MAG: imidazole glycerol phosphate synthase subunit HisH [Actinomycetota bacterium]|jgi:glutamine amidotransferase